jgi:hypothetical protein
MIAPMAPSRSRGHVEQEDTQMRIGRRVFFAAALIGFVAVAVALAGTMYNVACGNKDCGYRVELGLGGTMLQEVKAGWCVNCQDFVAVGWTRPDTGRRMPGEKPIPEVKPVGKVWLPTTGQVKPLYPCPKCKGPFLPIDSIEELKCCPKCGKPSIKAERTIMYD